MNYLDALEIAHETLEPRFYVEIGCWYGTSLTLAKCPSLAIDPKSIVTQPLLAPTRIYRETSDEFFARLNVSEIFQRPPDLAFIDGMHLVEFALRDFMNLEKHAAEHSAILTDDILPADISWASRERETNAWTGDVYKLIPILRKYRPHLEIAVFDIEMKGLAVISNLNPGDQRLSNAYDEIVRDVEQGAYTVQSVEELRRSLDPRPPHDLKKYLQKITRAYRKPSPA